MKHRILNISIVLVVTLWGLITGSDVQANDGVVLTGDVLVVALPIAAAGMTIGLKDGQGALLFGESAALSMGTTFANKYAVAFDSP